MERLRIVWWLGAGVAGAIAFWLFQIFTDPVTIPQFMGQQIVAQGGYAKWLTVPIGWGIHAGVSLSYSLLFVLITLIPFVQSEWIRLIVGIVIGAALAWITTLLTVPAITATISVLSGKGFPASLPALNTTFGLPFWNHMLFFAVVWAVYLLMPCIGKKP